MLRFITSEAKRPNISIPCVTFDQPLWSKAAGIIAESGMEIIARLSGFYIVVSFLGSVDKMMWGSVLKELVTEIYI